MTKKSKSAGAAARLAKLHQDYEGLKAQIQRLGYILSGSVQKRHYRCGKPNCRCMTEGILHGPYEQWTRKIGGKTVNLNLDPPAAKTVRQWVQNNRKLRQLCHRMEQIALTVLRTTTNMDKI